MKSKSDSDPKKPRGAEVERAAAASEAAHLSRLIAIADVPDAGLEVSIRADAAECAAIAESDGLVAVESLEADLKIVKQNRTQFKVSGLLRAHIVQTCVVSLDPFQSEIQADVEADFIAPADAGVRKRAGRDVESEADAALSFAAQLDAPDLIIDGRIDLGALVEEFLALNLNPYPRKPDARFDEINFSSDAAAKASPFAVLKKLKEGD